MAKVKLNPMFTSYTGHMGKIVHYTLFGRQYSRIHVIPKNPRTECQQAVRRTFSDAVSSWRSLTCDEKNEYNRRARKKRMRGYNLYISLYMKAEIKQGSRAETHSIQHAPGRPASTGHNTPHTVTAPMQLRSSSDGAAFQVKDKMNTAST